jgi:ferredoxin
LKVTIDREGCIECRSCTINCPEVFELIEGEKARIVMKYRQDDEATGEVGNNLKGCVADAVESCPVSVITAI